MCEYEADAYGEWQRSRTVEQLKNYQVVRFQAHPDLQAQVYLLKVFLREYLLQNPIVCR